MVLLITDGLPNEDPTDAADALRKNNILVRMVIFGIDEWVDREKSQAYIL